MGKNKKKTSTGKWFLIMFGMFFFLPGLGMGIWDTLTLTQSVRAQNWPTTEATVLSSKLKVNYNDGSTSYRATGEYSYIWQGQRYTSDRLFFGGGSDSFEKYHRGIVSDLQSHQAGKPPLIIHVNPKNPGEAVAYPKIRWGAFGFKMLFALIFGGVGAGIIAFAHYSDKILAREGVWEKQYPNQPWLWKQQWQTPEIRNDSKIVLWVSVVFATFWSLISLPVLFAVPGEILDKKNYLAAIALLFPIVGVGLIIWAYNNYRRWKRFSDAVFKLDTYPAALGHLLQGTLIMREHLPDDTVFNVKLSHIYEYKTGSGDDRRTVEDIKWQDEQHIPISAGRYRDKYRLPLRFVLPKDQRGSHWGDNGTRYFWRLDFTAEIEGVDFKQSYELPVFDPSKYKFNVLEADHDQNAAAASRIHTYEGDWEKTGVVAYGNSGSQSYYFPAARHKTTGFGMVFMTFIFGGVGISPFFVNMPWFIALVFGLFALLIGWLAAGIWLYKTEVTVSPGQLTLRRGMFRGRYDAYNSDDINGLSLSSTMTSGTTKFYDILAKMKSGKNIKLAVNLIGKRDAESLMNKISVELGLLPDK
jgi:hypothetical protein